MSSFLFYVYVTHNPFLPTRQLDHSTTPPILRHSAVRCVFTLLFALSMLAIFAMHGHTATKVTLAWDPNSPSENVVGYKLYFGTESGVYTAVIDTANGTMKSVDKLKKGMVYYFAATAYNGLGEESDFSEELIVSTCTFKLTPGKKSLKAVGGMGKIKVATQPECEWTAESDISWFTILEGHSGRGQGYISYSVDPNPDPELRSASPTFAGKQFKVTQKGTGIEN